VPGTPGSPAAAGVGSREFGGKAGEFVPACARMVD
jgi:hypothetical protein